MRDICNLYLKKLEIVRNCLYLVLELLQKIPPSGVSALLMKAADILPLNVDVYLRDFPYDVDDAENRLIKLKAAFRVYVQKIISSLQNIYQERKLQFFTNIDLNLSMSLEDNDPAAMDESDNLIFNIIVPWKTIWPEIILKMNVSYKEAADSLYNYILQAVIPSIEENDFLRVGTLYADITITEAQGYRLVQNTTKAIKVTQEEVADLLEINILPKIYSISSNAHPIAIPCITYIKEMITLIDQLLNNSVKNDEALDRLAIKLDTILHDYSRIRDFNRMGECLLSYADHPSWELFSDEHHAQMACLDGVMRELEDMAVEEIDHNHQNIETTLNEDGFEIIIEDFPMNSILTFWTNRRGFSCPVPFWDVEGSTGLFKDGEDWHEFHPYKPMCYLSHMAFVDGKINFAELKYINYITWEMRFRHDITVKVS